MARRTARQATATEVIDAEDAEVDSEDEAATGELRDEGLEADFTLPPPDDAGPARDDPVWTIVLARRHTVEGRSDWRRLPPYYNERMSDWEPDRPVDAIRTQYGPGVYRYDVKLGNELQGIGDHPWMHPSRTFVVEEITPRAEAAPPPVVPLEAGTEHKQLLEAFLRMAGGAPTPSGGGGDGQTYAMAVVAKDKADRAERALERIDGVLGNLRESIGEWRSAIQAEIAGWKGSLEAIEGRLKALEQRNPAAEVKVFRETAEALGMEQGGQLALAREIVAGVPAAIDAIGDRRSARRKQLTDQRRPGVNGEKREYPFPEILMRYVVWLTNHLTQGRSPSMDHLLEELLMRTQSDDASKRWIATNRAEPGGHALFSASLPKDSPFVNRATGGHWQSIKPHVDELLDRARQSLQNATDDPPRNAPPDEGSAGAADAAAAAAFDGGHR